MSRHRCKCNKYAKATICPGQGVTDPGVYVAARYMPTEGVRWRVNLPGGESACYTLSPATTPDDCLPSTGLISIPPKTSAGGYQSCAECISDDGPGDDAPPNPGGGIAVGANGGGGQTCLRLTNGYSLLRDWTPNRGCPRVRAARWGDLVWNLNGMDRTACKLVEATPCSGYASDPKVINPLYLLNPFNYDGAPTFSQTYAFLLNDVPYSVTLSDTASDANQETLSDDAYVVYWADGFGFFESCADAIACLEFKDTVVEAELCPDHPWDASRAAVPVATHRTATRCAGDAGPATAYVPLHQLPSGGTHVVYLGSTYAVTGTDVTPPDDAPRLRCDAATAYGSCVDASDPLNLAVDHADAVSLPAYRDGQPVDFWIPDGLEPAGATPVFGFRGLPYTVAGGAGSAPDFGDPVVRAKDGANFADAAAFLSRDPVLQGDAPIGTIAAPARVFVSQQAIEAYRRQLSETGQTPYPHDTFTFQLGTGCYTLDTSDATTDVPEPVTQTVGSPVVRQIVYMESVPQEALDGAGEPVSSCGCTLAIRLGLCPGQRRLELAPEVWVGVEDLPDADCTLRYRDWCYDLDISATPSLQTGGLRVIPGATYEDCADCLCGAVSFGDPAYRWRSCDGKGRDDLYTLVPTALEASRRIGSTYMVRSWAGRCYHLTASGPAAPVPSTGTLIPAIGLVRDCATCIGDCPNCGGDPIPDPDPPDPPDVPPDPPDTPPDPPDPPNLPPDPPDVPPDIPPPADGLWQQWQKCVDGEWVDTGAWKPLHRADVNLAGYATRVLRGDVCWSLQGNVVASRQSPGGVYLGSLTPSDCDCSPCCAVGDCEFTEAADPADSAKLSFAYESTIRGVPAADLTGSGELLMSSCGTWGGTVTFTSFGVDTDYAVTAVLVDNAGTKEWSVDVTFASYGWADGDSVSDGPAGEDPTCDLGYTGSASCSSGQYDEVGFLAGNGCNDISITLTVTGNDGCDDGGGP